MILTLKKLGTEGNHLKPTANNIRNGEKLKAVPLRPGTKQAGLLLPVLFNTVLGGLGRAIIKKKKCQIGKEEVKISLPTDDMIFYVLLFSHSVVFDFL